MAMMIRKNLTFSGKTNADAVNKVTISVQTEITLSPRTHGGTSPVGSRRRITRRVPPPLREFEGDIQAAHTIISQE